MSNTKDEALELAVVSALINMGDDNSGVFDNAMNALNEECFTSHEALSIYKSISALYNNGMAVDITSISSEIMSSKCGISITRVSEISSINWVDYNLAEHCKKLRELAMLRMSILKAEKLRASATQGMVDETYSGFLQAASDVETFMFGGIGNNVSWSEQIKHAVQDIEYKQKKLKTGKITGIPTPLNSLNRITGGWQDSELIILAARPSMGKTAFALKIMESAAQQGKHPLFFSLEMSRTQLLNRFFTAYTGGIDPTRCELKKEEWELFEAGIAELESMECYIEDKSGVNIEYIRSFASVMKRRGLCDMIIVDYLQLTSDSLKGANKDEQVGHKTKNLKELARTLDIPVVCLAQLNRSCEGRADKRPLMSDLRESGNIEQDADIVAFLYRDAYYGVDSTTTPFGDISSHELGELIIRKNRSGSIGTVYFTHNTTLTEFRDYNETNISSF